MQSLWRAGVVARRGVSRRATRRLRPGRFSSGAASTAEAVLPPPVPEDATPLVLAVEEDTVASMKPSQVISPGVLPSRRARASSSDPPVLVARGVQTRPSRRNTAVPACVGGVCPRAGAAGGRRGPAPRSNTV